jgi:pullulanase/glycogen debranching enzyme
VSYNHKHNHANREGNRDGSDHNLSWNCGAEGITDDPAVNALRRRQKRNLLATLLLSQGVPMLLAGDEMGRTQRGNNNAYCQDNEISWLNWGTQREDRDLLQFVQRLIALRREHPVLRRGEFFQGRPVRANGVKDIMWFSPEGREMNAEAWRQPHARCLGIQLAGNPPPQDEGNPPPPEPCPQTEQGPAKPWRRLLSRVRGWFGLGARSPSVAAACDSPLNRFLESVTSQPRETVDGSFLILVNAHHETVAFVIPGLDERVVWSPVFDTDIEGPRQANAVFEAGGTYALKGRSVVLLSAAHRGSFLAGALAMVRDH